MKTYSHGAQPIKTKQFSLLLVGVSALALLAGCGFKNPFAEERPQQMVAGTRHAPILNAPQSGAMHAPAAAPVAHDVLTLPAAPPVAEPAPHDESFDLFSYFGKSDTAANDQERKPIPGNPGVAAPMHAPDLQSAAVMQPHTAVKTSAGSPPAWKLRDMPPTTQQEGAIEMEQPVAPRSVLARAKAADINYDHTPELSSVPPAPARLEGIKEESRQQMNELQSDRARAQADKAALIDEPSTQQPAEVQEVTPLTSATVPQTERAAPSFTPRRGVDIMTQEQWNALHNSASGTNAK